jgi:hypothetical protein
MGALQHGAATPVAMKHGCQKAVITLVTGSPAAVVLRRAQQRCAHPLVMAAWVVAYPLLLLAQIPAQAATQAHPGAATEMVEQQRSQQGSAGLTDTSCAASGSDTCTNSNPGTLDEEGTTTLAGLDNTAFAASSSDTCTNSNPGTCTHTR